MSESYEYRVCWRRKRGEYTRTKRHATREEAKAHAYGLAEARVPVTFAPYVVEVWVQRRTVGEWETEGV